MKNFESIPGSSSSWLSVLRPRLEGNPSQEAVAAMDRARMKLRGALMWMKLHTELMNFGTSAQLAELNDVYNKKANVLVDCSKGNQEREAVVSHNVRCLITQDSKFKQYWNIVILFLLLYVFTGMPYIMAFKDIEMGSPLFYFELVIDCLFFVDMVITFNSSFLDGKGVEIKSRKEIVWNYLNGVFLIDLVAIFPFYLLNHDNTLGKSNSFIRVVRITKLTRIFRGSKILSVVKNFTRTESTDRIIKLLHTYNGIARLASAVYIILILAHFIACLWYFVAKLEDFGPDTWVYRRGLLDASELRLYISSLYFSFAILTTVGFGDIHAMTISEKILCVTWMVFGIGFYSFIIGTLTSLLSSLDTNDSAIKAQLELVEKFSIRFDLSEEVTKCMKKAVKRGKTVRSITEEGRLDLLNMMPKQLKHEISMQMYNEAAIKQVFFEGTDPVFISFVMPRLAVQNVNAEAIVYMEGDHAEEMYLVEQGRVNYSKRGITFNKIVTGSYFGEIELFEKSTRQFSTNAEEPCRLLTFRKEHFEKMIKSFPKIAKNLRGVAEKRNKRNSEYIKAMNISINTPRLAPRTLEDKPKLEDLIEKIDELYELAQKSR